MKKKFQLKVKFLTAILIVVSSYNIAQSDYHFRRFADSEKLSSGQVNEFFQDSYGFMWIVTSDGINRYDGKTVKIYKNQPDNEQSLPDNDANKIVEDLQNNLWVACYNAIGKLERKTDKFKRYGLDNLQFKSPPFFLSSLLDKDGGIWFTVSKLGVIRYNKEKDLFENIKLSKANDNVVWGEVHSIAQLKNGVIIVADFSNGLKKYNPETNLFDPYNLKPGFSPKSISIILESSTGNIWFGGNNVVIKYSPTQYIYNEYSMDGFSEIKSNYHQVRGIIEDDQGNLWISQQSHGLFKVDKNFENAEQFTYNGSAFGGIYGNDIRNLYLDKYDIVWLTSRGVVQQLDLNANSFGFSPYNISSVSFNNRTNISQIKGSHLIIPELIIGTESEGIISYNTKTKKFRKLNLDKSSAQKDTNIFIRVVDLDNEGNIWYTSDDSRLNKLNYSTKKITSYKPPYYNFTAVKFRIQSIKISPAGEIWITSNLGIDRFNPLTGEFTPIPRIMNKKINSNLKMFISEIVESREPLSSILKVGEAANKEVAFSLDKKQKVLLICLGEGRAITHSLYDYGSLFSGEKNIWAFDSLYKTFYSGGGFKNRISVKCLELEKGNYKLHYQSDVGHSFGHYNTVATPDSNWWGIQAFKISDDEFKKIKELNEKEIIEKGYMPFEIGRAVEFSKKYSNVVWIGTFTNSFYRYNLSSGKYKQYHFDKNNVSDASHYINSIYEDSDGILWVGSYSSLIRLNPDTDEINVFTTVDGIPGGIIYSTVEDNYGALWIHSSGGLSKLNKNAPIDKYVFVNYDSKDGLEGLASNIAIWKDENGKIYYGGKGGIISFIPGNVNVTKPDIVVSDFKIDDISIFADSSQVNLEQTIFDTPQIELSYFQNNISFEFAAIHFSRPAKNKIAYKLEGFNNKWYESDRNYVSFTNLDPGEYTFIVKGANGDGIWNEDGRKIKIFFSPPWWQTTFAYISYGIIFVLGVFGVDRFQRRRLLAKARERARIKESEMRAQIAEAENERKTKELEEARELQLSMLPKDLPNLPNLDIAVYMQTATEVGGDYYDFHVGMDGTLTVVVGDATGHGMKAGTMVTTTKSLFNILAPNPDILSTFSEISRVIKGMKFHQLSMCLMLLKIKGNELSVSSAAMPPALIYRKKNQAIEEIFMKGMPLG
jgi:ligand-binding sensor domain-containing protein